MAGTKIGGAKAAATNKAKYGADFYVKIGAAGGKKGRTGGFWVNRELARIAGQKGGSLSKKPMSDGSKRPITIGEKQDAHLRFEQARAHLQEVHDKASVQS